MLLYQQVLYISFQMYTPQQTLQQYFLSCFLGKLLIEKYYLYATTLKYLNRTFLMTLQQSVSLQESVELLNDQKQMLQALRQLSAIRSPALSYLTTNFVYPRRGLQPCDVLFVLYLATIWLVLLYQQPEVAVCGQHIQPYANVDDVYTYQHWMKMSWDNWGRCIKLRRCVRKCVPEKKCTQAHIYNCVSIRYALLLDFSIIARCNSKNFQNKWITLPFNILI